MPYARRDHRANECDGQISGGRVDANRRARGETERLESKKLTYVFPQWSDVNEKVEDTLLPIDLSSIVVLPCHNLLSPRREARRERERYSLLLLTHNPFCPAATSAFYHEREENSHSFSRSSLSARRHLGNIDETLLIVYMRSCISKSINKRERFPLFCR